LEESHIVFTILIATVNELIMEFKEKIFKNELSLAFSTEINSTKKLNNYIKNNSTIGLINSRANFVINLIDNNKKFDNLKNLSTNIILGTYNTYSFLINNLSRIFPAPDLIEQEIYNSFINFQSGIIPNITINEDEAYDFSLTVEKSILNPFSIEIKAAGNNFTDKVGLNMDIFDFLTGESNEVPDIDDDNDIEVTVSYKEADNISLGDICVKLNVLFFFEIGKIFISSPYLPISAAIDPVFDVILCLGAFFEYDSDKPSFIVSYNRNIEVKIGVELEGGINTDIKIFELNTYAYISAFYSKGKLGMIDGLDLFQCNLFIMPYIDFGRVDFELIKRINGKIWLPFKKRDWELVNTKKTYHHPFGYKTFPLNFKILEFDIDTDLPSDNIYLLLDEN